MSYVSGNFKDNNWKYSWKVKNNNTDKSLPVELEKDGYTSFATTEDLDGASLTATVELIGLPVGCQNTFSRTFQILYNSGNPLVDEYENITFLEEKIRLDSVVSQLKEISQSQKKKYMIVFIFSTKNYKGLILKKRKVKISDYLVRKKNLSKDDFRFVIGDTSRNTDLTRIYIIRNSDNKF